MGGRWRYSWCGLQKVEKILQKTDNITEKFTFEIIGDVKSVQSQCNIYVEGCVSGGCNANGEVNITGHLSGGCNSNGKVTVGGHFSGGCNAGGNITVGGDLSGDINCGETVQVNGNVKADKIKGNLVCNSIKCDKVEGNVVCNSIDSDIVKGDIKVKELKILLCYNYVISQQRLPFILCILESRCNVKFSSKCKHQKCEKDLEDTTIMDIYEVDTAVKMCRTRGDECNKILGTMQNR